MAKRPSNRLVRKALREILEPEITALGFTGKYPEFRRDWQDETHFLAISTRKYGGGFSVAGAWRKRRRYLQSPEYSLPADEVKFVHTEFDDRATIVCVKPFGIVATRQMAWRSVGDFDYEHMVDDADACCALVREATELLPAMDRWLKTREPGLGIDAKGHRMRNATSEQMAWHFATGMVGQFSLDNRRPETPHFAASRESSLAPEYLVARE